MRNAKLPPGRQKAASAEHGSEGPLVLELASRGDDLATEIQERHAEKHQRDREQRWKTTLLSDFEQGVTKRGHNQRCSQRRADKRKDRCSIDKPRPTRKNFPFSLKNLIWLGRADQIPLVDYPVVPQIQH
jgi:hypothetical protein